MKALVVLHEGTVGGASRAVLRALPLLERRGFSFSFWAPLPSPAADHLTRRGYTVVGEPRLIRYGLDALREPPGAAHRLRSVPGYLRRFCRHLAESHPDLVYANTILALPEALAARSTGIPTLLHVHEMLDAGRRDVAAALLARVASDGVATVSEACAVPLRRRGLTPMVVTAGVDPPPRTALSRIRGRLVVGTLGTVSARKGSDLFVAAAEAVARRRDDVEFRLVGPLAPGAERPWAREVVERAARTGVRWSSAADPWAELREWDLFVLPTREDPFPLAVLEALAVGLPVVASNVGGLPEQVSPDTGVLVEPGEVGPLANAVEELLADPGRRRSMGERAAQEAAERFTPKRHADELEGALRSTVDAAGGRRRTGGYRRFRRYPGSVPRMLQRSLR